MRTVHKSIPLFATLFLLLLLLLIVIYDCVGTYNKTIIINWYVGQWWWIMSTCLLKLLSFPYPPFLPRIIITTLLSQAYTYSWVMLLIVLYDYVKVSCWYGWQQCNNHSWWCHISIVCRVQRVMFCPIGTIQMMIILLHFRLLSQLLLGL